ncbi:hypothetical protein FSP39_018614 [Pinctada imbricata]|uniref:Uncharacterized protein n=1 Tax=Pinctada imbricata TaxID=66713 RepID=A0AA89CA78_PINIB|nr:hypothetical protein FSP39_018614 [Pinctada imbricata]
MPAGNLLTAAALLFTGCSFSQMKHFADTLNLRFFNSATYNKIQGDLFKVVNEAWLLEREKVQKEVENKMLWLAGDGRCDSPGFSAKYGTYTLLDQETGKIVDFDVIHVNEVNNKSTNMEKEGMKRSLERVISKASVCVLATDRHVQIGYSLRTEFPEITHQYDVWHVSKSISKKLNAKSKIKGCEDLKMWIQAIINHFWWSVSTCNGNPDLLKEKWISVIHHCVDIHSWNSCDLFHACAHAPIPPEVSKNKQWLKRLSKCHEQLKVVVLDKFLLRSLEKLTLFCHTGELEVYHSMMLKYCPKKQHFSYEGMVARTQLAALDHNNGTERDQAVVQKGERAGELMYKQVFPKCSKRWVLKPIYVKKNFNFRKDLMSRTVEVRKEKIALPAIQKPNLPKNIATAPKPSRDEAIESHRSRMTAAHKDV